MNKSLFAKPICAQRLARVPQKVLSPLCVKQFITFLIALAAMTVSTTSARGETKSVKYLNYVGGSAVFAEATANNATQITSSSTSLSAGWYYVEGNVTINSTVTLYDDTHLILCDGATLTITPPSEKNGIDLGYNLTIYAQSSGNYAGKLIVNSDYFGIHRIGSCNLTVNGGIISVTSTNMPGIHCNNFTINGGVVTAVSSASGRDGINVADFTINGGKVSAIGGANGIWVNKSGSVFNFNGGQVTANGGHCGIKSDKINLGWINASDYITANKYEGTVKTASGKSFNIEDGGTLAPNTTLDNSKKTAIANKKLTPNTTAIYTVSLKEGVSADNVEFDKTKACKDERVAITVTPPTGYYLASLTCKYGSTPVDITQQANDNVFTMPAANVTVNATFNPYVAQIGDTQYATLAEALAAVTDGGTITIISDKDESGSNYNFSTHGSTRNVTINVNGCTYSFGNISSKYGDLTITDNSTNHNGVFNFGTFSNQGNITIKDVTVNCNWIDNAGGSNHTLTFDNANVVCSGSGIQWMSSAGNVVLTNGADVEVHNTFFLAYDANNTFTMTGESTILKLVGCKFTGYVDNSDKIRPYVKPEHRSSFAFDVEYGTVAEPYVLRSTWGIMLESDLGEISPGVPKATVTFYDGGTSFDPTAFTPSAYTTSILYVDNSDGQDHYVIAHIVPELFYWTDLSLLSAAETGTSLTGDANTITLLKRDQYDAAVPGDPADMRDRYDGAGWYYYVLPKGHSVAAGYATSTLGGEVVHKFDLADENTAFSQDFVNNTLTISRTTDTWKATLTYDKLSWKFGGSFALSDLPKLQSISFKKGDTEKFLQNDADALAGQIKNAYEIEQVRIGDNPLMLLSIVNGCFVQSDYSRPKYKVLVPFDGEGSSGNPWQINTAADLSLLAKCVNVAAYTFNGETLKMGLNGKTYDMSGSDFEPIGTDGNLPFCGTLLGNGSTIKNISYVFAGPSAVSDETQYGIGFIGNLGEIGEPRRSGNVDNIKLENCSFSSSDNDICYVGSIAGAANRASVSNCYVIGGNVSAPKPGSYAGAIVGKLGAATLKYNYYDYATTATLGSSTASGYTKRGICTETISVDPGTPSTYDWNDFPTNDGAMLWVKKASITGGTSANGSTVAFNKVTKGTDRYDMAGDDFYYAVGQTVTLDVNLGNRTDDIRTFCDELTALTVSDGTTNTDIKDALSFTMPGADATVTATIAESDWFTINTVNYNAADPTAPFAYNWMTFYHEWTMKDPTSGNNVAGKFVVTNYDDPTAAVEVKTITAVDPTAGTYTSAAINGSYSGVPTLFHYADNNNGVLPQKLKFTPDFNIEQNQTADRRFKGTATALALSASAKCYILNNAGDFILAYITPTDNTIAAHRCYVDLSGDNSNQARLISSGDATGIDSMVNGQGTMDNLDGDWFSLDGRRLNGQPTRKGIYIHHGKKTVIK